MWCGGTALQGLTLHILALVEVVSTFFRQPEMQQLFEGFQCTLELG